MTIMGVEIKSIGLVSNLSVGEGLVSSIGPLPA
jgi:hypothetical protein